MPHLLAYVMPNFQLYPFALPISIPWVRLSSRWLPLQLLVGGVGDYEPHPSPVHLARAPVTVICSFGLFLSEGGTQGVGGSHFELRNVL